MTSQAPAAKEGKITLTEDEIADYKDAFSLFDKTGKGSIKDKELRAVLHTLGLKLTKHELSEVIYETDSDGNGYIDFKEFLTMMVRRKRGIEPEVEISRTFRVFDKDRTNFISLQEIREILQNLNEDLSNEQINAILKKVDFDGDGEINWDDFSHLMLTSGDVVFNGKDLFGTPDSKNLSQ